MNRRPRNRIKVRPRITEKQAVMLRVLHKLQRATAMDISRELNCDANCVIARFATLLKEKEPCLAFDGVKSIRMGARTARCYKLADALGAMSTEDFNAYLEKETTPEYRQAEARELSCNAGRAALLAKNPEYVRMMELNVPYMSCARIAENTGETQGTIMDLAKILGLSLKEEDKEPRAGTISATLKHIPVGTEITLTTGWTSFHMPSYGPGIKGVSRHYAAD